jgi:hypothetical protein
MLHERHYTIEQANAARPWVAERLRRIRDARAELDSPPSRAALGALDSASGGGYPGREVAAAAVAVAAAVTELDAMDVVVRDLARGLVDFPSLRDGAEVYLCWVEAEEDEIAYWHDLDAGYAGRQPL